MVWIIVAVIVLVVLLGAWLVDRHGDVHPTAAHERAQASSDQDVVWGVGLIISAFFMANFSIPVGVGVLGIIVLVGAVAVAALDDWYEGFAHSPREGATNGLDAS